MYRSYLIVFQDKTGCYDKPGNLSTVLDNYESMEYTLCRQLCISQEKPIFAVGNDFCACLTNVELASMSSSSSPACITPCGVHDMQKCGDGTVLLAFQTGK